MEVYGRVGGGGLGVTGVRQLRWFGHFLSERFQLERARYKGFRLHGALSSSLSIVSDGFDIRLVVYGRGEAEAARIRHEDHTISRHPPATTNFQLKVRSKTTLHTAKTL